MGILLANNATSTLTTVVSTSGTTVRIDPADAGKFPAIAAVGDYFMAVLQDDSGIDPVIEIIKVTAHSGAIMTVQRAQEGTTGRAFPVGASFSLRLTAASMAALIAAAIVQMQEYPGVLRVITNLSDIVDPFGIPYEEGQYGIYVGTFGMYRFVGGEWIYALQFPQIQGYIANTQMTPQMITNLLLATDAVDTRTIADNAVTTANIAAGAVDTANLALQAVTAAKLADGAVTGAAVGAGAIGQAQLAIDSVGAAQIIDGAVIQVKVAAQAIGKAQIALQAVQSQHIDVPEFVDNVLKAEVGYVGATQITPNAITTPKIAANTIVSTQLVAGDIVANFLAVQTGYVNTLQIVNGAITTALIQNAAITTALIQTGAITTALIQTAAITTALIAEAAINTAAIQDLSVNGEKITGNVVSADYYAYGASPTTSLPLGVVGPDWGDGRMWVWVEVQTNCGDFNWDGNTTGGANYMAIRVVRDGAVVYVRNFTGTLGIYFPDAAGTGAHNYELVWEEYNPGSAAATILTAEIFIMVMSK